jgi:hypothetical protein
MKTGTNPGRAGSPLPAAHPHNNCGAHGVARPANVPITTGNWYHMSIGARLRPQDQPQRLRLLRISAEHCGWLRRALRNQSLTHFVFLFHSLLSQYRIRFAYGITNPMALF